MLRSTRANDELIAAKISEWRGMCCSLSVTSDVTGDNQDLFTLWFLYDAPILKDSIEADTELNAEFDVSVSPMYGSQRVLSAKIRLDR